MTGLNTDTFRQDSRPKADILLVIDDSGSMQRNYARLREEAAALARQQVDADPEFTDAWVLLAEAQELDYGLRLPGSERQPEGGPAHRQACLEALALC